MYMLLNNSANIIEYLLHLGAQHILYNVSVDWNI